MENALPPGQNHHAASTAVAKQADAAASSATGQQTAPRPAGPKPNPVPKHFATTTGK